jgi:hypothetical protein
MRKEQAGNSTELLHQANRKQLEHGYCEIIREVYQTIHQFSLDKFTFSFMDSLYNDLNAVVYDLDRLPEEIFKELIEVIIRLREARNELRLARFLFDLEEINPVRRLVMRNKAVLRGKHILHKVLLVCR